MFVFVIFVFLHIRNNFPLTFQSLNFRNQFPNQFSMDESKPSPIFPWTSSKYTTLWYIVGCEENTPDKNET